MRVGNVVLADLSLATRCWDTRLAYINQRRQWRLQVTNRHTGETSESYYKRFKEADQARSSLTRHGTTPAVV